MLNCRTAEGQRGQKPEDRDEQRERVGGLRGSERREGVLLRTVEWGIISPS